MAKCSCCGKGVTFGIKVSHSHRRSNRTLDAFCDREQADRQALCAALAEIGYEYSREQNRFV